MLLSYHSKPWIPRATKCLIKTGSSSPTVKRAPSPSLKRLLRGPDPSPGAWPGTVDSNPCKADRVRWKKGLPMESRQTASCSLAVHCCRSFATRKAAMMRLCSAILPRVGLSCKPYEKAHGVSVAKTLEEVLNVGLSKQPRL